MTESQTVGRPELGSLGSRISRHHQSKIEMEVYPYRAERLRSIGVVCRGCTRPVQKDDLGLAVMTLHTEIDRMAEWYHLNCFPAITQPITTEEIGNFEGLRSEDQKSIRTQLGISEGTEKDPASTEEDVDIRDYCVEYARSGRAKCGICFKIIENDSVRIGMKTYVGSVPRFIWFHVECFEHMRCRFGFLDGADAVPGFNELRSDDKVMLKRLLPKIKVSKRKAGNATGEDPGSAASSKKVKSDDAGKPVA